MQSVIGIFLHTCLAPVRVIDVLWRMNTAVSRQSINNAISSLAIESAKQIRNIGRTLECAYVLDNFDVQIRHKVSTVEQPDSALYHLISASLIKLVHCTRDDLKWSTYLWQRCRYNDMRTIYLPNPSIISLFSLHPDRMEPEFLDRRERFNSWKFAMDLCTHGPEFFKQYITHIRDPEDIEKIPIEKTHQVPAKAMELNNSTVDGNIDALVDLLRQGGVLDPDDHVDQDAAEVVIIIHGDLATGERIQTARIRRSIESTGRRRLEFVIFVPGLFHVKMACADALWRIFIEKSRDTEKDPTSLMAFISILYANQSSRIAANKCSFQTLNDCLVRCGTADRLECWRAYIHSKWPECDTLQKYADRKPSIDEILMISKKLALEYSSAALKIEDFRLSELKDRDLQYENTLIRIDYLLLYEELSYAIRCGDVGRVETCLCRWIPIFKGTGKHKYATMLLEFLHDVHFVYPPPLRKAVRYNWLCNPRGKPMGFRGVDWLLELNNLLTKSIYGGSGSNYTIARIVKESPLIQLFRDCKSVVEEQFLLTPKTMRHGEPNMIESFNALSRYAVSNGILNFSVGRTTHHSIPNYFQVGMDRYESSPPSQTVPVRWTNEEEDNQPNYPSFDNVEDGLAEAYLEV